MEGIFSILASPLPFIILISIVITVHELGHYWVGRAFGAAVESFSVGFGKPIFEVRDKRGTRWRVNWLPLGGFVKFVGEIQASNRHARSRLRQLPKRSPARRSAKKAGQAYRQALHRTRSR